MSTRSHANVDRKANNLNPKPSAPFLILFMKRMLEPLRKTVESPVTKPITARTTAALKVAQLTAMTGKKE